MITANQITEAFAKLRKQSPLVHNITNYVVMNNTANALLAIGASPVMAHAVEEVEDMVEIASSLVLNMGTLSPTWIEAMLLAGQKATQKGIPVVFDPVGVGATSYRTREAQRIIDKCGITVIRGNASEIMALNNSNIKTKGVDSTAAADDAVQVAKLLATETNAIVSISGESDFVTDGKTVIAIGNGNPMMTKVTGLGCTASAITGAFLAVEEDNLVAAVSAMAVMGIAGELAVNESKGPATLQMNFIDVLYGITEEQITKNLKISVLN